jgi:3'-5' exonuclease
VKFLKDLIFLDIETVSEKLSFSDLSEKMQHLWVKKSIYLKNDDGLSAEELYAERAGIYSEFGKVIVISIGAFYNDKKGKLNLRIKALSNDNEKELLEEFNNTMKEKLDEKKITLCAHNGKEFDFPYLARRMVVNRIGIPGFLKLSGKKPWEINHIDTLELWKFGDRKSFTSLELLTSILDIPSPKEDMDGSMVSKVYYQDNDLEKIASYCNRDVEATAQLYLRLSDMEILSSDNIHFVN